MPRGGNNRMPAEVKRRYFELTRSGLSGSDASQRVGVSLSCGSLWFIDAGRVDFTDAPVSPRFLSQDDRIEIADGLACGEPVKAIVQLCVVHLIRASLRYASKKYWVPLTKDLRLIYTAADEAAAAAALEDFAATWGERYPAIVKLWRAHWEQFTPFLAFPPEVRRVIYTTNLIESMNARLRKVTRNRGQFPSEQAALKVLYLAVRNLEAFRGPNTGIRSSGWKQALQAFTIYFEGRIPTP
jgi:mutator family transposase